MVLGRGRGRVVARKPEMPGEGTKEALVVDGGDLPGRMVDMGLESRGIQGSPERSSSGISSDSESLPRAMGRGVVHRIHKVDPRKPLVVQQSSESFPRHTYTDSSAELPDGASKLDATQENDLSVGPTVASSVLAPGRKGKNVPVRTNLFDQKLGKITIVYRYRVDIERKNLRSGLNDDLGKGAGNDHVLNRKREQCFMVVEKAKKMYPAIFKEPEGVAFDRRNMAVSTKLLVFPGDLEDGEVVVNFNRGELPGSDDPHQFVVRFKYESKLDLKDLSGLTAQILEDRNREVQQLLEIILSQHLYKQQGDYVHFGPKTYQRKLALDLGNGRYLSRGLFKALQPTTDEQGTPILSVIVDNKNAAFYKAQEAMKTLGEVLALINGARNPYSENDFQGYTMNEKEFKQATAYFRDVNVQDMTTKRSFTVSGISSKTTEQIIISFKDMKKGGIERDLSLIQLYKEFFGYTIRFPKLQCFYQRCKDGHKKYVPIEICRVNDCQRVPLTKQTPDMMQKMIKESALKPSDLKENIRQKTQDLQLLSNATMAAFGIETSLVPRVVKGRVVPKPDIKYAGNILAPVDMKGDWKMNRNKFHSPGKTGGWAILAACRLADHDVKALNAFQAELVKTAATKGLVLPKPLLETITMDRLEDFFLKAANNKIDFLLFVVGDDKAAYVKDRIKLGEALNGIITQCVTLGKAKDMAGGKWQITENVLNKMNMKLGGLNYELALKNFGPDMASPRWLCPGKVLILGADVNHPPPQLASQRHLPPREPSVVGFVGNGPKKPLLFTGEISYQPPREEMVQDIVGLVDEMLRRWANDGAKGSHPEEIIYFRDGVSDGQFRQVIEQEVEGIRTAAKRRSGDSNGPKITCIVAKKRHNLRMFSTNAKPGDRASDQDLEPGTVLDSASGITHPGQANFYLKSHIALQGTARATHYSPIVNEANYDQDELDQLVFALAHNHQIVSKSVSLPAPVYGAHEMAERGKRLWKAKNDPDDVASNSSNGSNPAPIDYVALTKELRVANFPRLSSAKHWA